MRAGLLNRRISLQQKSAPTPPDPESGAWTTTSAVWANRFGPSAAERFIGSERAAESSVFFRIRYKPSVNETWRVVTDDNAVWNIDGVFEGEGVRTETILACSRFSPNETVANDAVHAAPSNDIRLSITTRLVAHAGTTALIGTRAWFDHLPQGAVLPACAVQLLTDAPGEHLMGEDADKNKASIRVLSYGASEASAHAVGLQVYEALSRWGGTSAGISVTHVFADDDSKDYDDDMQRSIDSRDFTVWYVR